MSEDSSASTSVSEDESSSSSPAASSKPSNSGSPARSSSQSRSSRSEDDSRSLASSLRRISRRRGRGRSGVKETRTKRRNTVHLLPQAKIGTSTMPDEKKEENTEVTEDMGGSSVETKSEETTATSSGPSPSPAASTPTSTAISEPSESNDAYGTALHSLSTSIQTLSFIDPSSTIRDLETGKRYQEMFDKAQKDQAGRSKTMERVRRRKRRRMRRLLHQHHHHHPRNLRNRKMPRLLIPKPKLLHAHFLLLPPHLQKITNLLAHHRLLPLRPQQQRRRVERKPTTK
nr:hypothetical protein I308_06535 [Cryptococcus tetragattii IND107]